MKKLVLIGCVAIVACRSADSGKPAKNPEPALGHLTNSCFLGHQSAGGDSILVCITDATNERIDGKMRVSIPEKDARTGVLHGRVDAAGLIRATYSFMQEGMADSIGLQLRFVPDSPDVLLLRPSGYDPGTGREYPDSSREDWMPLRRIPAQAL